jgi:hypothetical protein
MAENRQCGYCRAAGHRRPDCPVLHEHRNLVLTHTPKQRKELIEALGRIGLGNGGMFKNDDWAFTNRETIAMIRDFNFVQECNFIETKNVKYSKQVRIDPLNVSEHYVYRGVYVRVLVMGDGKALERNMRIAITRELNKLNGTLNQTSWAFDGLLEIAAPCHEVDYDPEILITNVTMPRRLLLSGEKEYGHTGIMPQ